MNCSLRDYSRNGSTLIEAVLATAIVSLFLGGVFEMNGKATMMLKKSVECTAATSSLQMRVEQVRTATWEQINDPTYICGTILSQRSGGAQYLGNLSEKVTINTYPEPLVYHYGTNSHSTVEVTRASNGSVAVTASGDGTLASGNAVRVDFTATWEASGGISHTRQMSTFVSKGGITGRNQ